MGTEPIGQAKDHLMGFLSLARERDVMKKKMRLREKIFYLLFQRASLNFDLSICIALTTTLKSL